jgi:hypothetical protein
VLGCLGTGEGGGVNVSQCDNCRRLDPSQTPAGWLIVIQAEPAPSSFLSVITGSGGPEIKAMFCTWKCAAEYAMVQAVTGEVQADIDAGGGPS